MIPINDPRPFAAVLREWIERRGSWKAAAAALHSTEPTLGRWLRGEPCATETAQRALMTLVDEGRA